MPNAPVSITGPLCEVSRCSLSEGMKYAQGCRLGDRRKMRLFLSSRSFLIHLTFVHMLDERKTCYEP